MRRVNVVNRKQALRVVKELDAFPKVPENYVETSAAGGGLSIVTFIVIIILVLSEVSYYSSTELEFDYEVDTNHTGKLKLNIDMTVAMKCHHMGADVLDQTGQDALSHGQLQEEAVFWELTPKQRAYQQFVQEVNEYLQEEYHAIQEVMWKSGNPTLAAGMPERDGERPGHEPDACRVSGTLEVNKVEGNFHVIGGKSVPVIPRGHAHLAIMMDKTDYNFSHRIDHFSFGEPVSGVIFPLDGTEMTTGYNYHTFQYFMQVVPTQVRTYRTKVDTYQFAVTQKNRPINHAEGSHGNPGIFIKYDLSSLMIRVREEHKPYWQFLVRMCGIIGGVFAVSGMLNSLVGCAVDFVCCRYKSHTSKTKRYEDAVAQQSSTPTMDTPSLIPSETSPFTSISNTGMTSDGDPMTGSPGPTDKVSLLPQTE